MALQPIGYDLIVDAEDPYAEQEAAQQSRYRALKRQTIGAFLLVLPIAILGMFGMELPYMEWISLVLTTPVLVLFGRRFYVSAWRQARLGKACRDISRVRTRQQEDLTATPTASAPSSTKPRTTIPSPSGTRP